jgi:uncharacterized protein (DUF1697 family)
MARHAALLRAVNVAGNKLAMRDLTELVERLGGGDVRTYLQSGNVVYSGPAKLGAALEKALRTDLGVEAAVLVRSAAQLATIVEGKPFAADGKVVSVTFLRDRPAAAAVAAIDPTVYDDEFVVAGREIYLHTPNGYGRSKLLNQFWERKLGTVATTRNWNTVVALAEMTA